MQDNSNKCWSPFSEQQTTSSQTPMMLPSDCISPNLGVAKISLCLWTVLLTISVQAPEHLILQQAAISTFYWTEFLLPSSKLLPTSITDWICVIVGSCKHQTVHSSFFRHELYLMFLLSNVKSSGLFNATLGQAFQQTIATRSDCHLKRKQNRADF